MKKRGCYLRWSATITEWHLLKGRKQRQLDQIAWSLNTRAAKHWASERPLKSSLKIATTIVRKFNPVLQSDQPPGGPRPSLFD
jgi:hypothetical protein